MEKEGNAAAAAGNAGRWEASADGVIVLPAGSAAAPRKQSQREKETQVTGGPGGLGDFVIPEPPEKVFYKTKLCEKFESGGRCAYEDGCTFAHGHAELRPPLPLPAGARRSRLIVPPVDADGGGSGGKPVRYFNSGKICYEFRDKGTCHFGSKCNFSHSSAVVQPGAEMRYKPPETARRSATPPARAFSAGSAGGFAPAAGRAFPPSDPDASGQGEGKPTRLELLSRKKMSGIYGDWPEGL